MGSGRPAIGARRPVRLDSETVRIAPSGERSALATAETASGVHLQGWLSTHRGEVDEAVRRHGALLLRGFDCDEQLLQAAVEAVAGALFDYSYRSTPRSTVSGRVYTSTEYPADQQIPLHNEMSYASVWPRRLWFLCVRTPASGGTTPVASSRSVWERISPGLRRRFDHVGVEYRRRFGPHLDLPWQEAFQTSDRSEVDARCRVQGMTSTWLDAERLVTSVVRPATITHPEHGAIWFNQAHLFHTAALPPDVRAALLGAMDQDELPRYACFGDGTPITDEHVAEITASYEASAVEVDWRPGDVLLVDNEAVAHGRRPYVGDRRVVVAMSSATDLSGTSGRTAHG